MEQKKSSEAQEQSLLIEWANFNSGKYPKLKMLFHIPNGGSRNIAEAVNLKRQGVKAGVPDLCLPVPNKESHGLFIEMKYGKNKCSDNQKEWLCCLNSMGYEAVVCYSFDEAKEKILKYLKKT